MGAEARTFVSPAMCGCEMEITAEWSTVGTSDGKSYQHPASKPGLTKAGESRNTVQFVKIMAQCSDHAGWEKSVNWEPFKVLGGYMDIPANPTPGDCLYINHWRYSSLKHRFTLCDCEAFEVHDASDDSMRVVVHPQTLKCKFHTKDDASHSAAFDLEAKRSALAIAFEQLPSTTQVLTSQEQDLLAKLVCVVQGVPLEQVQIPLSITVKAFSVALDETGQLVVDAKSLPPSDAAAFNTVLVANGAKAKG